MMLSVMIQHFKILLSTDEEDKNVLSLFIYNYMMPVMIQHIKILPSTDEEDQKCFIAIYIHVYI